jgi:type I restriction-modification system DNA methylase subunit
MYSQSKDFYIDFGFDPGDIQGVHDIISPNEELRHLVVDKVYHSGGYPALLFKEVKEFSAPVLLEIAQAHHSIWNYKKVMFLIVLSPTEVRIYDCCRLPFNYRDSETNISNELAQRELISAPYEDVANLETVRNLFSKIAIDSGLIWSTDNLIKDKIAIQQRVDRFLVKSLLELARRLKNENLSDDIIHSLLMRAIFIMYLEDKGAASETTLYSQCKEGAETFLEVLNDKDATYQLFNKLEEHFRGNVFPILRGEVKRVQSNHLELIKKCLTDGDLSSNLKLFNWRLFKFDIIQIELLSEIYENFLAEFKVSKKEESGQYYTPPSLVEFILNTKLKVDNEQDWNVRVLDPACGSGIFLVESYKRLVKRWKNANEGTQIEFKDLRQILKDNIYGIEFDRLAVRVTAFSLYLAMVEHLNPKTLWIDRRYKFPHLINDPKDETLSDQGANLFRADTLTVDSRSFQRIDLVVGNPPFGSKVKLKTIRDYCKKYGFGLDMVVPFLHKAMEFAPTGSAALIFNTKVLTNTEGPFKKFRKWLFDETYVERIYNLSIFRKTPKAFGGQLFPSAVGPVSILYYQKEIPQLPSETIEYWAPKTYVKSNVIEGVLIDHSDIKMLPRDECSKPDSTIWKVAMWGSMQDFKLLKRLEEYKNLKQLLKEEKLKVGVGVQFLNKSTTDPIIDENIPRLKYVTPENVQRYTTPSHHFGKIVTGITQASEECYRMFYGLTEDEQLKSFDVFRRVGSVESYKGPHVLIKKGLSDKKICASFIEHDCSFNSKVWGIASKDARLLKAITALVNSKLASYYIFLISSSFGIEREEVKPNEFNQLPWFFKTSDIIKLGDVIDKIIERIRVNQPLSQDYADLENELNTIVYQSAGLTENEMSLIEDFHQYNLPLVFDGHKAASLKPSNIANSKTYAARLQSQIKIFLGESFNIYSSVYKLTPFTPLNVVKITLASSSMRNETFEHSELDELLKEINKYTVAKLAKSIFIQRQFKFYKGNSIYVIKPNQKRFWSTSEAINDASDLIFEVLKMSESANIA